MKKVIIIILVACILQSCGNSSSKKLALIDFNLQKIDSLDNILKPLRSEGKYNMQYDLLLEYRQLYMQDAVKLVAEVADADKSTPSESCYERLNTGKWLSTPNTEDIKILKHYPKTSNYGGSTIYINVKNTYKAKAAIVQAECLFYDKNGNIVEKASGSIYDLESGETNLIKCLTTEGLNNATNYRVRIKSVQF